MATPKKKQKKYGEEPWERQRGESAINFQKFLKYRNLLPSQRSYEKVAKIMGLPDRQILAKLGRQYAWVKRAEKWDDHIAAIEDKAIIEQRKAMNKRHRATAMKLNQIVLKKIESALEDAKQIERLNIKDIPRLLDSLVKTERLAFGSATEVVGEVKVKKDEGVDLSKLSDEELAVMEELTLKGMVDGDSTS